MRGLLLIRVILSFLKMEAARSYETWASNNHTKRRSDPLL